MPFKAFSIGRLVGDSPVALGSTTTNARGEFDFTYRAAPGGTFCVFDSNLSVLYSFGWANGSTTVLAIDFPVPYGIVFTTKKVSRKRL